MTTLRLQILTCMIAVSYLTLGAFDRDDAEELWWIYALLTFLLAAATVIAERRTRHDQ